MQVNIHEAKTQLSRLLQLAEQGEQVFIARDGKPVVELVRVAKKSFPFGIGCGDPLVKKGDAEEWLRPMTDDEYEDFLEGKY